MFKKGMTVYNKTHKHRLLATLIAPRYTPKGTPGWVVIVSGSSHKGFWFDENMVPLVGTNDDAVGLLHKDDSL